MLLVNNELLESRNEFELAVKAHYFISDFEKDEFGRYLDRRLDSMWWSWQEREETLKRRFTHVKS